MTTPRAVTGALVLLVLLGTASGARAAPLAHRETLPNGIVLLVAERPAVPIVAVRVYTRAGSAFEPADRIIPSNVSGPASPSVQPTTWSAISAPSSRPANSSS